MILDAQLALTLELNAKEIVHKYPHPMNQIMKPQIVS